MMCMFMAQIVGMVSLAWIYTYLQFIQLNELNMYRFLNISHISVKWF